MGKKKKPFVRRYNGISENTWLYRGAENISASKFIYSYTHALVYCTRNGISFRYGWQLIGSSSWHWCRFLRFYSGLGLQFSLFRVRLRHVISLVALSGCLDGTVPRVNIARSRSRYVHVSVKGNPKRNGSYRRVHYIRVNSIEKYCTLAGKITLLNTLLFLYLYCTVYLRRGGKKTLFSTPHMYVFLSTTYCCVHTRNILYSWTLCATKPIFFSPPENGWAYNVYTNVNGVHWILYV